MIRFRYLEMLFFSGCLLLNILFGGNKVVFEGLYWFKVRFLGDRGRLIRSLGFFGKLDFFVFMWIVLF